MSPQAPAPYTPGIDVSHFQGSINWSAVRSAGLQFSFLKCTDGRSYIDPTFRANVKGCVNYGIWFGAYHFFRPSDDPVLQANLFLEVMWNAISPILPRPGVLPPALDLEIAPIDMAKVQAFLDVLKERDLVPLIYCSPAFARAQFPMNWGTTADFYKTYPLWIADYTTAPAPELPVPLWSDWEFWQHTPKGQVPGVPSQVDLNRFHGTPEDFIARFTK